MKFIGIGILFSGLLTFHCMPQSAIPDTLPPSAVNHSNQAMASAPAKMHVNVMAGTQFWTAPGYGSGLGSYLMTGINWPAGKRFNIGGGIGVMNNTMIGIHQVPGESFVNGNYTNALVYVTGQYLLSQRITVTGTVFKEFSVLDNSREFQRFRNNTPQGAYLKVNYRINDFMQIEAGFGYSRGINPYYNTFMGSPRYDGLFSDPFLRH